MHLPSLTQRTLISLAVLTTFGVLVHDTKLDQAATLALAVPFGMSMTLAIAPSLVSEGHTHVERGAYGKTTVMGMPRIQTRDDYRTHINLNRISGFNVPEPHSLTLEPVLV